MANRALGLVLLETASSLHRDQDNAQVRVLDERSGTATGTRLPRLFLPHALYFLGNQYLQQRAAEVRQTVQSVRRFLNLRSYTLCSHIFKFPFGIVIRQQRRGSPQDCCPLKILPRGPQKSHPATRIEVRIEVRNHHKARRTRWLARVCLHRSRSEHLCTVPRACVHRTGIAVLRGGNERVFRTVG
jgi:hypothetical protein